MKRIAIKSTTIVMALAIMIAGLGILSTGHASASKVGVANYKPTADYLDETTCNNLGRLWVGEGSNTGCSREKCLLRGAKIVGDYNTESCSYHGSEYAISLESRLCKDLNRTWLDLVNRCLSNVDRNGNSNVLPNSPQCKSPYTTYIVISNAKGYDICVTPKQADQFSQQAKSKNMSVPDAVLESSELLCSRRATYQWNGQKCRPLAKNEQKKKIDKAVFIIGDSVTWRAANEVTDMYPTWEVDGQPGSALNSLPKRLKIYLGTHTMPKTFVVALGTNNGIKTTTKADYDKVTRMVPASTNIVFVTPYRDGAIYGKNKARLLNNIGAWMTDISKTRPHTCIAPWADAVKRNNRLVVDGVHERQNTEQDWADIVSRAAKACS